MLPTWAIGLIAGVAGTLLLAGVLIVVWRWHAARSQASMWQKEVLWCCILSCCVALLW
jgi:hypothetical protein